MEENLIKIENIRKTYTPGKEKIHALDGISLDIKKGEYIAIMGASGSGKSTLMNIIGCLDVATSGKYYLKKHKVQTLNNNELATIRNKEIGFVFQTFNLLARSTALHNVELPLIYSKVSSSQRKERSIAALKKVGLGDRMMHKPNELSGGQKQRVAVARALINDPSIILADEPTGNLDSKTSIDIMNLFNELHEEGNTIIVVTHEPDIAEFAKRVIHLKDGKIEQDYLNGLVTK
jgi:putative ABC transport system ATP-binding protein